MPNVLREDISNVCANTGSDGGSSRGSFRDQATDSALERLVGVWRSGIHDGGAGRQSDRSSESITPRPELQNPGGCRAKCSVSGRILWKWRAWEVGLPVPHPLSSVHVRRAFSRPTTAPNCLAFD